MKRHRVLLTDDEREALEAIRPYACQIAAARRAGAGALDLATSFHVYGVRVLWAPSFWWWLSEVVQDAQTDAAVMVAALHGRDPEDVQRSERQAYAGTASDARRELERLFVALRGEHKAGRPKGTPQIDAARTEAEVDRLERRYARRRGNEAATVGPAVAEVARAEGRTPAAIRKRLQRRKGK